MKKLSIKEKAKAYDEVLERAKEKYSIFEGMKQGDVLEDVFPELKESEDEKVEMAIFGMVYDSDDELWSSYDVSKSDVLAWLEKQGKISDKIVERARTEKQRILVTESDGVANIDWDTRSLQDVKLLLKYGLDYIKKLEKQDEQKPTWSAEDERHFSWLIEHLSQSAGLYDNLIDWLKSLKDRVQPQPKQEWKQENTGDLNDFENAMMHIANSFFGQYAGLDPNDTNAIKEQANLLLELVPNKEWSEEDESLNTIADRFIPESTWNALEESKGEGSCAAAYDYSQMIAMFKAGVQWLKEKYTWKPSKEQMEFLLKYAEQNNYDGRILTSLYQDLKKLKG